MTQPAFLDDPQRACDGEDTDLFFPEQGQSPNEAKAICSSCPFTQQCQQYAASLGTSAGVWGGVNFGSAQERKKAGIRLSAPVPMSQTLKVVRAPRLSGKVLEVAVRERRERGVPDTSIALQLGIAAGTVGKIRAHLGLVTLYGPAGKPLVAS